MNDLAPSPVVPGDPVVSRRRLRPSLVWLVPALAGLIGISMLINAWLSEGPEIAIGFRTAAGLEAGKTPVKYKDVTVGTVSSVALSDDGSRVIVKVDLSKSAQSLLSEDTLFWVVRPRIGAGGVSGIDTLLSGAYIAVDRGVSAKSSRSFVGLENPPSVSRDMQGKSFLLHAQDMGSLDIGSPVYYRRIQVGHVATYHLDASGKGVDLQIFVDAPYDGFVTTDSRFWNASGVDVSLGAEGFKLKTQALSTLVSGGIAFASPPDSKGKPAASGAPFELMADQEAALAAPDGPPQYLQMRFDRSLRGLAVGAPVFFAGMSLGKVVSVDLDYDKAQRRFPTVVGVMVYPQRLGAVLRRLPKFEGDSERRAAQFLGLMVERGLRAQARTANLLTGQLYISLDFEPNAPQVAFDASARPVRLPTVNGEYDRLHEQVSSIIAKIDKLPFKSIGKNLDDSLATLDKTLKQINNQVAPEATQTLQQARQAFGVMQGAFDEDAPLPQSLGQTLQDVQRSARSLRVLTDLLGRHPESLLRGLPSDPKPAVAAPEKPSNPAQEHPQ